ncbi:DNA gyrase subunit A [Atopobacter sp. AH10]|uniref:DNA gyrase subunit A n=1 Tax=Atopobacter sp. AH10 TaxID=2315861 RepID=UPI0021039F58|nr:DNA gyrase subunit A [Atopobacter sp. AH10]
MSDFNDFESKDNSLKSTVELSKEMRTSFLQYSMSVIVSRALPDVRDGLKPVHRRILYGMNELGVTPDKPHKKSARIVGDVMGKYHPHGDYAIYESMVRMAQDFSYRYPLVDGHGNFGSIDGDGAAAMRYTESRLSKISLEMLRDINKETIDYMDNYDGTEKEPSVLPARFPNLLVNGATGIAVGMATNIPPHNLGEVIDALDLLMENPNATTAELMTVLPGPDFPTGGIVLGKSGIRRAYETGRGKIVCRAKLDIETLANGKERIVITEIPYMVNKAKLVSRIAELHREKRIEGLTYLNDESDRNGMRIVIEVRKDVSAHVLVNNLYKLTPLQTNFGFNMLAIVNGVPRTLSLKEILVHYLNHQEEVVRRRAIFDKKKAEARVHILEGLQVALDHIDAIVAILRQSKTGEEAKQIFMQDYGLSDIQAQAILDMRMIRLTGLEREKIDDEHAQLMDKIKEYNKILASEQERFRIIQEELAEIRRKFGDSRRTELLVGEALTFEDEDLIEEESVVVTLTHNGYIKRLPDQEFKTQNRGGRGVQGMSMHDNDFIENMFVCSSHDDILFFTNKGKVYKIRGYEIPEYSRTAKGLPLVNLLPIEENETVEAVLNIDNQMNDEEAYLFFVTELGIVKRTKLSEFQNIRTNGLIAIGLREGDEVIKVRLTDGKQYVILGTQKGQSVTFEEKDVRAMGRTASGVKGISLQDGDQVIAMDTFSQECEILAVTDKGYGKRTPSSEYSVHKRGGKGIKAIHLTERNGQLVALRCVYGNEDAMMITDNGVVIRCSISGISQTGRSTQGVKIMRVDENSKLSAVTLVDPEENEDQKDDGNIVDDKLDQQEEGEETLSMPTSEAVKEHLQDFASELVKEDKLDSSDD